MSEILINHSPDLHRLFEEGYSIRIQSGHLVIDDLPYLTNNGELRWGALISKLSQTVPPLPPPTDHTVFFIGEMPCQINGMIIAGIEHPTGATQLAEGLSADRMFSSRSEANYPDYYAKMIRYIDLITTHAIIRYPGTTPRQYKTPVLFSDDNVFVYHDTAAVRAQTVVANNRFIGQKIAIVGLGGTGSYILDMVAKTRVAEIHLFDGDSFCQHNAFRSPGAASLAIITEQIPKVSYLSRIYSVFRHGIVQHNQMVDSSNINDLTGMDFVFIAVDKGPVRGTIATWLSDHQIPFIDVGMGLDQTQDARVFGRCRVTIVVPGDKEALQLLPTNDTSQEELYKTAIQTVEMNAINAALAVTRWKRYMGFYKDESFDSETLYNPQLQSLCVNGSAS